MSEKKMVKYDRIRGVEPLWFDERTPVNLMHEITILERAERIVNNRYGVVGNYRVFLHYGNPDTGRDNLAEWDNVGRISRSSGKRPIPIIVHNRRSSGGTAIDTESIVKIRFTNSDPVCPGKYIWKHQKYHHGLVEIVPEEYLAYESVYRFKVTVDGEEHARFRDEKRVWRWLRSLDLKTAKEVFEELLGKAHVLV